MKDRESGGVASKIMCLITQKSCLVLSVSLYVFFQFVWFFSSNCLCDHYIYFLTQTNMGKIFYFLRKVAAVGGNYVSKSNVH